MKLRSQISLLLLGLIVLAIATVSISLVWRSSLLITEKIYVDSRSFAELTAERMSELVDTYLPAESFVVFKPQMQDLLLKNSDVGSVEVFDYQGIKLYDSLTEADEQYQGPVRELVRLNPDDTELNRLQAAFPSIRLATSEDIIYLKKQAQGYAYVDLFGNTLDETFDFRKLRIENIVYPVNGEFGVRYNLNYDNLSSRIISDSRQILFLGGAALLLSLVVGLWFAGRLSKPLSKLTGIVGKIAGGDLEQTLVVTSKNEVGDLATAVNQMVVDLKRSLEARIFKEKTQKELELAAQIQASLIPKEIPDFADFDLDASLVPAGNVSGDVYDVIEVNNEHGHYAYFYLGDVTGHGIPASLLSATANAMIAMLAPEEPNPVELLTKVNRTLKGKTLATVFITMTLLKYDFKTKKLTQVQAGHEPILCFRAQTKTVEKLPIGGLALAMLPEIKDQLVEQEILLQPGDNLILYSDGLPEAWQSETQNFGEPALIETYTRHGEKASAKEIKDAILYDINKYRNGFEQKDDMTILVLKTKA